MDTSEDIELRKNLRELYFAKDEIGHFRQLSTREVSSILALITKHTEEAYKKGYIAGGIAELTKEKE